MKDNKFANIALLIGIAFAFLIVITILKNMYYYTGSMGISFYAVVVIAVIVSVFLFKCKPGLKGQIALLLITTGICIYSAEILLELLSSSIEMKPGWLQRIEAAKNAGIPFDSRTRIQVLSDLRKEDDDIYHAIGPSAFARNDGYIDKDTWIHPLGSISNRTLLACNEYGDWLTFRSDKYGFRNPQDTYDKSIDIALIGDSFTEGLCVEDGHDIAGWLRKKTGMNILNLGYGSNSSLIELASMKEFAEPFKPKIVLMFYYAGNDMEALPREAVSPILMKYLDRDFTQNLITKQEIADRAMINYQEKSFKIPQDDLTRDPGVKSKISWARVIELQNLLHRLGLDSECYFTVPPLFTNILVRADTMAQEWGGKFIFVYLTGVEKNLSEDKMDLCRSSFYATQREKIFPLLKELGISFIDIDRALSHHPDPYSLYPSFFHGHHNSDGYKFIVEESTKYLAENNLISLP